MARVAIICNPNELNDVIEKIKGGVHVFSPNVDSMYVVYYDSESMETENVIEYGSTTEMINIVTKDSFPEYVMGYQILGGTYVVPSAPKLRKITEFERECAMVPPVFWFGRHKQKVVLKETPDWFKTVMKCPVGNNNGYLFLQELQEYWVLENMELEYNPILFTAAVLESTHRSHIMEMLQREYMERKKNDTSIVC